MSQPYLRFLKKPETEDEGEIAALLEAYARSVISRNRRAWRALFSDDALLYLRFFPTGEPRSPDEVAGLLPSITRDLFSWRIDDVVIECADEESAATGKALATLLFSFTDISYPLRFEFTKKSGRWLIKKISSSR